MPEPKIKKEQSEEPPLLSVPSKLRETITTLLVPSSDGCDRDEGADLVRRKPLLHTKLRNDHTRKQPLPVAVKQEPVDITAARPASATHRDITPQKYKIRGIRHTSGPLVTRAPPAAAWLSSHLSSALATQQQTAALNTTRPQSQSQPISSTQSRRALPTRSTQYTQKQTVVRVGKMDPFSLDGNNAMGFHEYDFDASDDGFTGMLNHLPQTQTPTVMRSDYEQQQDQIRQLQSKVERLEGQVINGLISSNRTMQSALGSLTMRVVELERNAIAAPNVGTGSRIALAAAANPVFDAYPSGSPLTPVGFKATAKASRKRSFTDSLKTEGSSTSGPFKYRKKLQVEIPANATTNTSAEGLPTPMLSAFQTVPSSPFGVSSPVTPGTPFTPFTPGRIGPPESYKKTPTTIQKRKVHNLNKFIPPSNVQLPRVPLTDVEMIVYFFNSLTRPIVSLRLYARGWGPISISQALNEHREVNPPYLRNTCSVKCSGAIKNGRKKYGDNWELENTLVLKSATDELATDIIRATDDEAVDYYIRALGVKLKQHPSSDVAGIFTKCVEYCIETGAPYTVSNVHKLAFDLHYGHMPQHPASPDPSDVASPPQIFEEADEDADVDDDAEADVDAEGIDDDGSASPSPLAARKPRPVSFTAATTLHDHDGEANE